MSDVTSPLTVQSTRCIMFTFFLVLLSSLAFSQANTLRASSLVKRDAASEKEVFDLWTEEMDKALEADFQEFMKEMEKEAKDEKSLKNSQTRELMSQNTVDKFQELMASMRKDISDEFWKFMKEMQGETERAMEGFMSTMEKEMDDSFDEFYKWITGADSTRAVVENSYQRKFEDFKNEQLREANSKFENYSKNRSKK